MELAHENGAREEHDSAEMRSVSGNILLLSESSRSGENTAQFCAESRDLIAHDGLQPAVALYRADEATGSYWAFGIQVITLDDVWFPRQIAEVTAFLGHELVTSFGFPLQLPH